MQSLLEQKRETPDAVAMRDHPPDLSSLVNYNVIRDRGVELGVDGGGT